LYAEGLKLGSRGDPWMRTPPEASAAMAAR
jgi:hypothetical protein